LIAIRPESRDANFTWHEFETHVNTELNDVFGNFINRTLKFINNNFESRIPDPGDFDQKDDNFKKRIVEAPLTVTSLLDQFELKTALSNVIELARIGNQFLSEREPWHLVKTDPSKTATTLFLASQLVRTLGVLVAPFLPQTAMRISQQLNISQSLQWSDAGKCDLEPTHLINQAEPLFHKVEAPKA
jgi:methionyl-tRNA synthetase